MPDPAVAEPGGSPFDPQQATCSFLHEGSPPISEFRRVTRGLKRRRGNTATFTGTNKTPSFDFSGGGKERGTNLDEIAWLIANLKETITQQNETIETVKN